MITSKEIQEIDPIKLKRLEIAQIQKLWGFLPKDFAKQLAEKFDCSPGMAKYIKDIESNDPKSFRLKSKRMLLFLGLIASKNKEEIDEINNI